MQGGERRQLVHSKNTNEARERKKICSGRKGVIKMRKEEEGKEGKGERVKERERQRYLGCGKGVSRTVDRSHSVVKPYYPFQDHLQPSLLG